MFRVCPYKYAFFVPFSRIIVDENTECVNRPVAVQGWVAEVEKAENHTTNLS